MQDTVEDELSIPAVSRKRLKSHKTRLVVTKNPSPQIEEIEESTAVKTFKVRRKGPLKLRFHHQALPQAYLNHYENTQGNFKSSKPAEKLERKNKKVSSKAVESLTPPSELVMNNENILSWLHSILELQQPEDT